MAQAYLEALNPAQRQAVEHGAARPLLVIAGAGSGKTNTLAHRVAHLIVEGADPRRILLMTFSRRAASEIRPLLSETRFFVLSADVDTWFAETPEPPRFDRRSSGGTLTALRHAPCPRAPEAVRRAASAIGP